MGAGLLLATTMMAMHAPPSPDPPAAVRAADFTDEVGTQYRVERESIAGRGNSRTAWVHQSYRSPSNPAEAGSRILYAFRCADALVTMRSLIFVDAAGRPTRRQDGRVPWLPVIPGTPAEGLSSVVCGR